MLVKLKRTMKAQMPKKKEKSKKEKDPDLGHEQDLHHPGSVSFKGKPRRSWEGRGQLRRSQEGCERPRR